MAISPNRRDEFAHLFAQAVTDYLATTTGQEHLAFYAHQREEAQRNLERILAKRDRDEDVIDDVLLKLLPYSDTAANREAGAWVHVAPAITGNLRLWYERAHVTQREDWPRVAEAILALVVRCVEHPEELAAACEAFSALPYSKGFQTGMLSPILNALNPDAFRIMNNKVRAVVNYLAGTKHGQPLLEYAASNATVRALADDVTEEIARHPLPAEARIDDVLDLFCHWLVSVRKYEFGKRFRRLTEAQVEALLDEVRRVFPGWTGVDDPIFVYNETAYKRDAVETAQELLAEDALGDLIASGEFDEVLSRLERVGKATNLLYLARPRTGDLGILYQESLDKPSFARAVVDLLYGEGPSEERLERYAQYVEEHGLPSKWTFPTYLLFLCHPDTEMFVKPYTVRWLFQRLDLMEYWDWKPNRGMYALLKDVAADVLTGLEPYGGVDMIDAQSVIWTGYGYKDGTVEGGEGGKGHGNGDEHPALAEPFSRIFADWEEAEWAFDLMSEAMRGLGITDPEDERYVVSLRQASRGGQRLRLLYGNWPVLGFRGPETLEQRIEFALLEALAQEAGLDEYLSYTFSQRDGEPKINEYMMPMDLAREMEDELRPALQKTLAAMVSMFGHWERSGFRGRHQADIAKAILDPSGLEALLREGLETESQALAEPFASIFADGPEAEWALGLLREAMERLGIQSPEDERFVISVGRFRGGPALRFIFGPWVILGFYAPRSGERSAGFALLADEGQAYQEYREGGFAQEEPQVDFFTFPYDDLEESAGGVIDAYWRTLDALRAAFGHWSKARYHGPSQYSVAIARALMEDEVQNLLSSGLAPIAPDDRYFTEDTFDLLSRLSDNPTKVFYQEHREEFREQLEEPFDALMADLAEQLPQEAKALLETEKGLTSRVLKNDYGRGGAWDHYWGAFYPQGSKRTADAQLYVYIRKDLLRFGFYIGDYGEASRDRFDRNMQAHRNALAPLLGETFADMPGLAFGEEGELLSFNAWLRSSRQNPRVSVVLSVNETLEHSREELRGRIGEAFRALYPLMLLTISDNPLPAIRDYLGDRPPRPPQPEYTLAQCAQETGFSEEELEYWLAGLERKKQAILYGPPGTGKTYLAERLARHLVGGTDGFVTTIQFHPAYAYEDFVQGIRPQEAEDGGLRYPVVPGHFLEFCAEAAEREGPCVLIIDEINRAELSRVFGELMYLLEYRGQEVHLAVDRRPFSIPENVRMIGTMNTADRSIALVDHALRRRFAFIGLYPQFEVLRKYHAERTGLSVDGLIGVLQSVNQEIGDPNYAVGITFFLHPELDKHLASIWQMEIVPYLEEYFFDNPRRVDPFRWESVRNRMLPGQ